jgi:undecaprenyl-diphosphatase
VRDLDVAILRTLNGLHGARLDALARWLAEWGMYALLALIVALALRTRTRRDVALARDGALVYFAALFVAETVIKPIVQRPRPTADALLAVGLHLLGPKPPATSYSFPSGTATTCLAAGFYVWLAWGPRVGGAAVAFAALVSLSRVYAGVHWPSDLVGAALVAWGLAWGVHRLSRWSDGR